MSLLYSVDCLQSKLLLVFYYKSYWVVYFSQVEGNGSCLYASIRQLLAVPQEYTNSHMCHEVAFYLATHMDQHQNDLIPLIHGIYGAGDTNTFPQSVCSYLQEILQPNFWADEIVLRVLSLLFISPSQSSGLGLKLGSDMTETWPM